MKMSQLLNQTRRERPSSTDTKSHQLLLQAGYVRQHAAGLFSYLHLGQKTIQKITQIMREEIDRIGGQEINMPFVHPASLWQETGRWYDINDEMARFQDKNGRHMVLAMTHEEIVTDLVRQEVQSHRQLPKLVYQIQSKWRDDPRPRAGLIRAREFTMLDGYSFDKDDAGLDAIYQAHLEAYACIFERVGLPAITVEADVGMMGGKLAHEMMYLTPIGEDTLLLCDQCGYQANRQVATFRKNETGDVTLYHFLAERKEGDALIREEITAVLPSTHAVNETKLSNYLKAQRLIPINEADFKNAKVIVDDGVVGRKWADMETAVVDITAAQEGDLCVNCGHALRAVRGVEIGNIFKLDTRYSKDMQAQFTDSNQAKQDIIMGCYGIGVTRLLACLAEHHHDEKGLRWPKSVAPYQLIIVALRGAEAESEALYKALKAKNVAVILDDRDVQPGTKFHDADLIGIPLRITMSKRSLANEQVEFKLRSDEAHSNVHQSEILQKIVDWCHA